MVALYRILYGAVLPSAIALDTQQNADGKTSRCSSAYLSSSIEIPNNAKILNVAASSINANPSICNVTVTYTHPGWNDTININILLPSQNWNERFQGVGGGGWATNSGPASLLAAVAQNYSAGNTDGGHPDNGLSSAAWAFKADGQLNIPLLEDFASVALNDLAVAGKQVSKRYYGHGPRHSYWNGCSTGGRQGLMMAQRYPTAYSGIYAGSPAIHWESFQVAQYWGQFIMNQLQHYPPSCVFDYITAAAVKACDDLDGVVDGVIANLQQCHFDPYTLVGQAANCTENNVTITAQDAEIAQKVWQGPRAPDGTFLWWGIERGAAFEGLTDTICTGLTNCSGYPFGISTDWTGIWVLHNPNFDFQSLTLPEYSSLFERAYVMYHEIIGTENPDLRAFQANGGKMITWHGLADQLIYPSGTISYYEAVEAHNPSVRDFYRFFPAPGVGHCGGGAGEAPTDPFDAVVDWVEKGRAPETLAAISADGTRTRDLCQFPLVSVYQGGDPTLASSFACKSHF